MHSWLFLIVEYSTRGSPQSIYLVALIATVYYFAIVREAEGRRGKQDVMVILIQFIKQPKNKNITLLRNEKQGAY